ncbi:uncharacterized protein LOC115883360 [Sitophilus oryzae]|uniref:Uncharacterized protein LOC115883360 n=1 Tax=Sitophilus oryzae TaxID=7048 RepID=A0A6J2Y3K0_SITOR|nr:uncharacterized protein LOC115883360 [Sitophilus oryzae]
MVVSTKGIDYKWLLKFLTYFNNSILDNELANRVLQREIERKNRLAAFRYLKDQASADLAMCSVGDKGNASTVPEKSGSSETDATTESIPDECSSLSNRWSDSEIKLLLENYRNNIVKLKDKKFRSKSIYSEIAKNFPRFTEAQVETKLKNLKKTYKVILDNSKSTGRGKITWSHFDQMHDIFGSDPENKPISIASSSSGFKICKKRENNSEDTDDETELMETPKRKKTKTESTEPEWFNKFREEMKERHNERMALETQFLTLFKAMVDKN